MTMIRESVSFGAAARRYFSLILTLLRREEELRRRAPLESILSLLEPVVLIAVICTARWLADRLKSTILGETPILYYTTGFFAMYFFVYLSNRMKGSVDAPNQRFPVEQRLDHIVVHILLRIFDYSILGILLFGVVYWFFTPRAIPHNPLPIIQASLALIMMGFGWGILTLVLSRQSKLWRYFFPVFNRCAVIFSGVFFVVDFLSPSARYILSFNPLMHALSLFRMGFYPNPPTLILDTTYLFYCAVFALLFGLALERVTRRTELK